ncbi:uncharacterized protein METZ01_LOCUS169971 [marine metagenome]|uniref:Guanylate cyclase domain-containing protein n=1 Tax=marine metagenome TaxID=408172 RepID=A0A382BV74_9ZZZZ
MSSKDKRKLAAIMFADVVGYSRMMARNEERTLELLKDFENICSPIISDNEGTIIKKVGDELFCEFSSAKQAVDCSLNIQKAIQPYNDSRPKDFKLQVRIGIHIGDIVLRDGDVFGDGVNVASRIQPFSSPGGICISNTVKEALSSHPNYDIQTEGKQELKNIIEKHTLYSIKTGFEKQDINIKKKRNRSKLTVIISLLLIISIAFIVYKNNWWFNNDKPNKYFIHITSNEKYIEDYYVDMGGMLKGLNKNKSVITSITDSSLNYIHEVVFSNVISRFHNLDVEIETHVNKEELNLLNELPSHRGYLNILVRNFNRDDSDEQQMEVLDSIASSYLSEETYLKFENKINKRIDFVFDYIIVIDIYNLYDKELDKSHGIFYDVHWLNDFQGNFVGPYAPGTFDHSPKKFKDSDELIKELTEVISKAISQMTFGNLIIGEVSEILDNNMVRILRYDNQSVNRNVTLVNKGIYVWIEDGYEKRIEDIELGLEYYQNNPEKFDSTTYQQLLLELKGLKDGTDRNRGERSGLGVRYTLDIIDVIDNMIIAKIVSKNPPYSKVRLGDKIRIKFN